MRKDALGNAAILLLTVTATAMCQQTRPEKAVFQAAETWPAMSPADVELKNFRPFRAVYERHYVQGAGPDAGEPRSDEVIVTAERVAWDGEEAALVTLIDTANAKWDDTAARNLFMIVDVETLALLFESGPVPGKAKDYYFMRPDTGKGTMVTTENGTVETRDLPPTLVAFGPSVWAVASLDLKEGMKLKPDPVASPPGNVLGLRTGIAKARRAFTDLSGAKHDGWLIESPGNMSSSRMEQIYVVDRPPYFLARFSRDLETGEESQGTRLKRFQLLE